MAPPLRRWEDAEAVRAGLADGTIDCVASDHAPHSSIEKEVEFDKAAFGIVGLETSLALSLALARDGVLSPVELIGAMTNKPAAIIGIERGTLSPGAAEAVRIRRRGGIWRGSRTFPGSR